MVAFLGRRRWATVGRLIWALALAPAAQAAQIVQVSPQGEVAQVRQLQLRFNEAVVPLGDLRQGEPVTLSCQGGSAAGTARWLDDRNWVFDFNEPLGPGMRCTVKAREGWKPLNGELTGRTEFTFATGGPAVVRSQPWQGATVDEDQHFILQLSGPVVEAEAVQRSRCEVEGIGEGVPVRSLAGPERDALLKARNLDKQADRVLVLACSRPLPPKARLRLVWGKGIPARNAPQVVTTVEQRFDFRVREAFHAEFSCERERAGAPCLPIRPLVLRFSAPLARSLAAGVRLQPSAGGAALAPHIAPDAPAELSELRFLGPFAERSRYTITLPPGITDSSGRALANAGSFPLQVATGEAPPIAKFAAAPFGVVEWGPEAAMPLTLRQVQGDLRPAASGGRVRALRLTSDADVIAWYRKLARYHESQLPARVLGLPREQWTELVQETGEGGRPVQRRVERMVGTREVSLLATEAAAQRLDLPVLQGGDPRPFEVIGIPLAAPGYHVLEVESARLGQALLDKPQPMFVRSGVLVTNLGVHFKQGRENAAVWVTTLDRARPVADAEVALSDCRGQRLWAGRSGADGVARVPRGLTPDPHCEGNEAVFVSARKADARGVVDMAFVWNGWVKGIEPWRFGVATRDQAEAELRMHTVFDRTLLRAGETVSMKHFVRRETLRGLEAPDAVERPTRVSVVHEGSGERFSKALSWAEGRSALSSWNIPAAAKLGLYRVELDNPEAPEDRRRVRTSGEFRVEAFRVPLVDARLWGPRGAPVAPRDVVLSAQLQWMAGGPMAGAALRGSALLRPRDAAMPGWPEYSFAPPRRWRDGSADAAPEDDEDAGRVVADKVALVTDRDGSARFAVQPLPAITRPSELQAEVSFADPNGEQQTVSTTVALWPAALALGVRAPAYASAGQALRVTVIALDLQGRPLADQAVQVAGRVGRLVATRKRIVGGFYAYEQRSELRELGVLCSGRSDARGLLVCTARPDVGGQLELIASARDAAGNTATSAATVWMSKAGEGWFEQDNDDRIDVLPDKRRYEGGDTARLQVRMPFREATAWIAVEREGVIDTRVATLRGDDPTIELKIDPAWGPNVYVSVLVLRGRIRHVPWTSFFDWGWKSPLQWARAWWIEGPEFQPPTALVDLSRPAFKLGVAALQVGLAAHELQVAVTPEQSTHRVRGTARVRVKVTQGGQPVSGAELAFAAVDEGLLALRDNDSWQLLQGLMRPRAWGVQTATAASEIVGRRHYGRKAVAAGGGGGRGATRELFDTLLLWRPRVVLDARGEALIEVPLNDSLTSFRLVAVADDGAQRFGTGSATIRVTQDLQLLQGLPALVRDGDRFIARLTLRNTTQREMKLRATLAGTARRAVGGGPEFTTQPLDAAPQDLVLAAGAARELQWPVEVPAEAFSIGWEAAVQEQGGGNTSDRVKWTQLVAPAVPLRVLQATLRPLDAPQSLPVAAPAGALAGADGAVRGGVRLGLQPSLAAALPGLRRFFETYPYSCLEQKASKAIGLGDAAAWQALAQALPTYLDADGLAAYFPAADGDAARGSDRLTAYLLSAAHEAGFELPAAAKDRMLAGLAAFVEGRIERRGWSPRPDLDVRKLAAIDALSRHGRASARQLGSITLAPQVWPTAALIDWLQILRRVDGVPDQARRLDEARALLRARLTWSGTTLRFSTEDDDHWWWLMDSADANAARLVLALVDEPGWRDELPRLVVGALQRQTGGAWRTTTANLWGALALLRFAQRFEATPVAGRTQAMLGAATRSHDWQAAPAGGALLLPWPAATAPLSVQHEGAGRPWLTVQALAAVPLISALNAGYAVSRSVSAVERRDAARWSRGDVVRVRLELQALADMSWVVVADPVPGGASILGTGLGRDSALATRGEAAEGRARPVFVERDTGAYRAYFEHLPRGRHVLEYTLRLNHSGRFALPPTRVEAMYAPEAFGESPNAALEVAP